MKKLLQLPVLALGFRPFFLLGPVYVIFTLAHWTGFYGNLIRLPEYFSPMAWHAHEMLFGFVTAIIAGFLLTASRNWTNTRGVHGGQLLFLLAVWVLGRVVMLVPGVLPAYGVAIIELGFLPLLIGFLANTLIRAKKAANLFLLVWLLLLFVGNILMHLEALGLAPGMARRGYLLSTDAVLALILIMGGRVIPFFTQNALPSITISKSKVMDILTLALATLYLVCDFIWAEGQITGVAALIAGVVAGVRWCGWKSTATLGHPILWVLHLGYALIWLGLIARGLSMTVVPAQSAVALHVLTAGGMGLTILGMLSRVALGHTGRPLVAPKSIVAAYGLVALGAVVRVFTPLFFGNWYVAALMVAAALWSAGFILFVLYYWPILTKARPDGKPG